MASAPADEELNNKPEDELTNEERLAWLRARGVVVEEPASKRTAAAPGGRSFRFVRIPADEASPCEERAGHASDGDALPTLLGPEFAGGSVSDEMLEAKAAELGQKVSVAAMRSVLAQGGAEKFSLAVPTDRNGREQVHAYIDESSSLKGLPRNKRACSLAQQCGFPASCEFFGDVFVGRQKWTKEGLVDNIDFKLSDLDADSIWIRRATTENLEQQKSLRPEDHAAAQASGGGDTAASGEGVGYSWRDQGEEMEIVLRVDESITKKDVKIEFKRQEVRVTKPVSLTLTLFQTVDVDGCTWTMGKGQVVITLEKGAAEPWPQLLLA